jgi:protease IV
MENVKRFFSSLSKGIKYLTENFKGILLAIFIIFLLLPSGDDMQTPNVVRIDLAGEIRSADSILEKIEAAQKDKNIKGVLFVVNSPGGSVAPSIEIAYAIKRLATLKPVVTYAQGSIASGSYYASIWSHKIIANPGSLVGSIGVIFHGYNAEELMKKIGISAQVVKAGTYKEAGTASRAWNKYEKEELNRIIKDTYDLFSTDVAKARKLDIKKHKEFADAHIFSAASALKVGLIDQVATLHEAKEELKQLSDIKEFHWQTPSVIEKFSEKLSSKVITTLESNYLQPVLK